MSSTQYLELVYRAMPVAFFFDLLVFPLGLAWIRRWRMLRARRL